MAAAAAASAAAALAALALVSPPGVAPHGVVGCDDVAMGMGAVEPVRGEQLVFGLVAMPARFLSQVFAEKYPLAYFGKAGVTIRAGSGPIDIVVPSAWRRRVAIEWGEGDNSVGVASSLRFTPCKPYDRKWLPYAGGIHVSAPACVPLIVRAGGRSRTLHFGIGRRC